MSEHGIPPIVLMPADKARALDYIEPHMTRLHGQRTEIRKERHTPRRIVVPWEWPGALFDGATLFGLPIQRRPGCAEPFVDATSLCPECSQGKHANCDGVTWDNLADGPTTCPCGHRWAEVTT